MDSASERIKDRRTGTGRRRTRTAGHRHRRIQQMEGDPYYRRLPETCRQRTQAVWVPGGRDGMEQKCEDAHTLAWEETGGSVPAARYNPSTGREQQYPPLQAFADNTQHKPAGTKI